MISKLLLEKLCNNEKLILTIFILLYLILELLNITLPGLYADEAFPACGSLQILKNISPCLQSIRIGNINFPLMLGVPYETALESYILLPFLWIFGINVIALRLAPIVFGAFTLIVTYFFLKDIFDKKTGFLAMFLLVIEPIFLLETKLGLNSASMLHFAGMSALLFLWKWFKGKGERYFYLGIFMLGVGISIRVWFVWFVNGVFLLGLIYYKDIINKIKKNLSRYILIGIIVFCLGFFLFIVYNVISNFSTVKYIIDHFAETNNQVNNIKYYENLVFRLKTVSLWLDGRWSLMDQGSWSNRTPINVIHKNPIYLVFFLCFFVYLMLAICLNRGYYSRKRVLVVLVLFVGILLQTPLTLSSLGGPHLFILYPLIQIIMAVAFIDIAQKLKKYKAILYCISSIFIIFSFIECNNIIKNNYVYFKKTGGTGNYSDGIYAMSKYLEGSRIYKPIVMDWGIHHNLIFLSQGKIEPRTFSYIECGIDKEKFINELKYYLSEPNAYVFHVDEFSNRQDTYAIFKEICKEYNKSIITEKFFYQRDGRPVFVVYSVR